MTTEPSAQPTASSSVLGSSAVMAAGTLVSRVTGFLRNALLVAALGAQLHADVFTIANTIPNMLYILLAGGVFNAVLVPQLVRAMKNDADGGDGYTNRIITLAGLFLVVVTAALVIAAPLLMRLFLDGSFFTPDLASQRESVIDFARYCLPQVFFYGMFVLVGQVLNSRGRFGPMMWAPIANNVISVAVLGAYLMAFSPVRDLCGAGSPSAAALAGPTSPVGAYTTVQELVLGLGSTLGIAVQFLILVPYLKRAGFTYRPRFDFRGTGLSHTMRLGTWTVLFVVVNQIAFTIVVRIASAGTARGVAAGCPAGGAPDAGTGLTVYTTTYLLVMVPHSIATVSLATAMLPRLSAYAAEGDLRRAAASIASTLRTALALILPFCLLLPFISRELSNLVFGYGAGEQSLGDFSLSLALFAPALALFTVHYLVLRGFYALERTRTVFWIQCVIAAVNVVLAIVLTANVPPAGTSPGLVLAFGGSYVAGVGLSYALLRRLLGGLETPTLVRFGVRLGIAAGLATLTAWAVSLLLRLVWTPDDAKLQSLVVLAVVAGADVLVLVAVSRWLRIVEVTEVVGLLTRRLRRVPGA